MSAEQWQGGRFTFITGMVEAITVDVELCEDGWVWGWVHSRGQLDGAEYVGVNLANVLRVRDDGAQ